MSYPIRARAGRLCSSIPSTWALHYDALMHALGGLNYEALGSFRIPQSTLPWCVCSGAALEATPASRNPQSFRCYLTQTTDSRVKSTSNISSHDGTAPRHSFESSSKHSNNRRHQPSNRQKRTAQPMPPSQLSPGRHVFGSSTRPRRQHNELATITYSESLAPGHLNDTALLHMIQTARGLADLETILWRYSGDFRCSWQELAISNCLACMSLHVTPNSTNGIICMKLAQIITRCLLSAHMPWLGSGISALNSKHMPTHLTLLDILGTAC